MNPIKQILKRHKEVGATHIEVISFDDKKKKKENFSNFLKVQEVDYKKVVEEIEIYNISSYGVFMNINPLVEAKRIKKNVSKILYIFIDLDDGATEEHNNSILENLKEKNINCSYNAKSGHGYHILIPIELDATPENELKVKGFLTYIKENICNKVDIATYTNERLLRCPESIHNKDDIPKTLETLISFYPEKDLVEQNTENFQEYQIINKKGVKDLEYQNSIKIEDTFFNEIISNHKIWSNTAKILDKALDRNTYFMKNLGILCANNPNFYNTAKDFLETWESTRVGALNGWIKKAQEEKWVVNYQELLKWAKDNGIDEWVTILQNQLKSSILDEYEVYYLEDEKKENSYLLYFPLKNYYVQKNLPEILTNIYYDCKERGVDFEHEWSLNMLDKWDEMNYSAKEKVIMSNIYTKLSTENRIKKVFNINYEPSDSKFIYNDNKKYFNTYNKTALWDYFKKENRYKFHLIEELMMNLCNNNKEYYDYLNKWLAWIIQNPLEKLPTAIILQGRQGSGKGTFKNLILDEIFGHNCQEINQTHLESSFNEYLLGKQIIVANEVMHNENRQTLPNVLKNLVTDKTITISRKFKKEIVGKNYTHWIFCTNNDNPLKIDEDDRRYSVFYSNKVRKGLVSELIKDLPYQKEQYISYLKTLDVSFEEVSEPLMTEAKAEIIDLNKDSVDKFCEFLKQFNSLEELYISVFGNNLNLNINDSFGDGERYILTEKLYLLYEKWCQDYKEKGVFAKQNFGKRLSNKNIKSLPKRIEKRVFKMYNVKDLEQIMGV